MSHNVSYTLKTVKYGGPHILVWEAIKADGSKVLCRYPSILNSEEYQRVLDTAFISFLSNDSVVMQVKAPCHRSRSTLDCMDSRSICLVSD